MTSPKTSPPTNLESVPFLFSSFPCRMHDVSWFLWVAGSSDKPRVEMLTGISPAGSYLPSSYSFSPYGSKSSGSEESEKSRASPIIGCKSSSESKALDILQQHASHYKSKSPTVSAIYGAALTSSQLWAFWLSLAQNLWLFSRGS